MIGGGGGVCVSLIDLVGKCVGVGIWLWYRVERVRAYFQQIPEALLQKPLEVVIVGRQYRPSLKYIFFFRKCVPLVALLIKIYTDL